MKREIQLLPGYCLILLLTLMSAHWGSRAVTILAETAPVDRERVIVIDAGHGGVDGGATSCTGVPESSFNLQIALRLEDLLHLLGHGTRMIRREDISVYTQGQTIAQKKRSDLNQRVRIANETPNALLVSIHQNHFPDSRYSGAQVFYAGTQGSQALAEMLQSDFVRHLNPDSRRQAKRSQGVYLMEHVTCPAVLIECGFLSNPGEEEKLRTPDYQKQLCCVIAAALSREQSNT